MKFEDIKIGQEYIALIDHAGYGYKKYDVYKVSTINKANLIITMTSKNGHCAAVPFVIFDHDFRLHVVPAPAPIAIVPGDHWKCNKSVLVIGIRVADLKLAPNDMVTIIDYSVKADRVKLKVHACIGKYVISAKEFINCFSFVKSVPAVPTPTPTPGPSYNQHVGRTKRNNKSVWVDTKTGAIVDDIPSEILGKPVVIDAKPERAPLNDFVPEKDKLKNYFMGKKRLSD